MDGSLAGRRIAGRAIIPVSTYFATTTLPSWVYAMTTYATYSGQPAVRVDISSDSSGHKIVYMFQGISQGPGTGLWLLYQDFVICLQIARTIPIPLFPHESISSIMNRITGALKVQFADRGCFDAQR